MAERAWLADLIAGFGEPWSAPGPVQLRGDDGPYEREAWIWFAHGVNHNLAIDRCASRCVVRAGGCTKAVRLDLSDPEPPPDDVMRMVLVLAGLLGAEPAAADTPGVPASLSAGTL